MSTRRPVTEAQTDACGLLGLLVVVILAVAGCNRAASGPAASDAPRGMIGVSLLALDNPFFKVIGATIAAEGRKQGFATLLVGADKDPARQGNQVKDFLVAKAAAIVLSPCDSKSIGPVIREANAAGVPVFTVDIPCDEPGVVIATQVATDNLGGGREAGRAMIECWGRPADASPCSTSSRRSRASCACRDFAR